MIPGDPSDSRPPLLYWPSVSRRHIIRWKTDISPSSTACKGIEIYPSDYRGKNRCICSLFRRPTHFSRIKISKIKTANHHLRFFALYKINQRKNYPDLFQTVCFHSCHQFFSYLPGLTQNRIYWHFPECVPRGLISV